MACQLQKKFLPNRLKARENVVQVFRNLQGAQCMLINSFIRIFNTLTCRVLMSFLSVTHWYRPLSAVLFVVLLLSGPIGCQKLFHEDGALLKGQSVNLALTVPDTPPPAAKPLPSVGDGAPRAVVKPAPPLHPRLLPQEQPVRQDSALAAAPVLPPTPPLRTRTAITLADTVLQGKTISEDTTLRGTVLIKGSLVVAPQATLRLEPGTRLYFQRSIGSIQNPRLVVQGRLVCDGTSQRQVVIAPAFSEVQPADWGGVLLLSTEKKNSLDYCRIEGAEVAVEARFSQFTSRGMEINRSREGVVLYDSLATLQSVHISRCDIGLVAFDSELDLREATLRENRQGAYLVKSALVMTASQLRGNSQEGLVVEQGRFRITGCTAVENRIGMLLKESNGQIQQCRFALNRDAGLSVMHTRLKIVHASFQDNHGAGLRLEGAHGSVSQSSFSLNAGGNLHNTGPDGFAAVLNWWGGADEVQISAGIHDATRAVGIGRVSFVPFLTSRPSLAP